MVLRDRFRFRLWLVVIVVDRWLGQQCQLALDLALPHLPSINAPHRVELVPRRFASSVTPQ